MKYTVIFFSFLILFSFTSCKKDFLNVPSTVALTRQDYVKDLATTGDFLNGVYITLATGFYANAIIYPELIADNIKPVIGGPSQAQYAWSQRADVETTSILNMNSFSTSAYDIIRRCSFVIGKAQQYADQNQTKANSVKGQALTLRAMMYFLLVNIFAQPYNYSPNASHPGVGYTTDVNWENPVKRVSVKEVYDNIIMDLKTSIPLLPLSDPELSIANKKGIILRNAAKAFLARVYLFKGDLSLAKDVAAEVIADVPILQGASYPSKLFTPDETEALFQLIPNSTATTVGGTYTTSFPGRSFVSPKSYIATSDIALLLTSNPQDSRKGWVNNSGGVWNILKYPSNVIAGFNPPSSAYYQTVIRSSEMYLTIAECAAKLNDESTARFYLDAIRQRANPSAPASTASGSALIDSVYLERRKELAFEGLRMFDLLRCQLGVNRQDAPSLEAKYLPYPSDKAIAPIPGLDVAVYGISQNPGY